MKSVNHTVPVEQSSVTQGSGSPNMKLNSQSTRGGDARLAAFMLVETSTLVAENGLQKYLF